MAADGKNEIEEYPLQNMRKSRFLASQTPLGMTIIFAGTKAQQLVQVVFIDDAGFHNEFYVL